MDQFAVTEELKYSATGNPSIKAKQYGELSMAHEDCDTIPLLWAYADRFVLFDDVFESMTGPSTPGNLTIIGAQSGQTQWALHPSESSTLPIISDPDPFWGSPSDKSASPLPVNPGDYLGSATLAPNLTFATLPLSMLLSTANTVTATDPTASTDFADVQDDLTFLSKLTQPALGFGWYQEGSTKSLPIPPDLSPRTDRMRPISRTTMVHSTSAMWRTLPRSVLSCTGWAISIPLLAAIVCPSPAASFTLRAAIRTRWDLRQRTPIQPSKRTSWVTTTTLPIPTRRSVKPWWPHRQRDRGEPVLARERDYYHLGRFGRRL